jgi:hypothetical protein
VLHPKQRSQVSKKAASRFKKTRFTRSRENRVPQGFLSPEQSRATVARAANRAAQDEHSARGSIQPVCKLGILLPEQQRLSHRRDCKYMAYSHIVPWFYRCFTHGSRRCFSFALTGSLRYSELTASVAGKRRGDGSKFCGTSRGNAVVILRDSRFWVAITLRRSFRKRLAGLAVAITAYS